jgi:hypothetical protein
MRTPHCQLAALMLQIVLQVTAEATAKMSSGGEIFVNKPLLTTFLTVLKLLDVMRVADGFCPVA